MNSALCTENSEKTTMELNLDNSTYTNRRVVTLLGSTPVTNPTEIDPNNHSNTECDPNLSILSDLSCFPCDSLNYTTVVI